MPTKYEVYTSKEYRDDYRLMMDRKYPMERLDAIVEMLANGERLPSERSPHPMGGEWQGYWNCHIMSDWILIYKRDKKKLVLKLRRTGTHSDFKFCEK